MHPYLTFPEDQDSTTERCNSFLGRLIHHGRRIDWEALAAIGLDAEMTRLMHILPYVRIFNVEEPTYKELVCEFFSTFKLTKESVSFRLGGCDHDLSMKEFGIALGIWTKEETETELYINAITNFQEEFQIYWDHITVHRSVYQPRGSKASGIHPVLRYLHFILAHTITGRKESVGVVNTIDVAVLSHIYRGIPVDMTRVFARIAKEYATDTRKQTLGLGPFITRIARHLGIDIATAALTMVSTSTASVGITALRNMRMVRQFEGRWISTEVEVPPQGPPLPPVQPQPEPQQFVPTTAFERYTVARIDRIDATLHTIQVNISELTQQFRDRTDDVSSMINKLIDIMPHSDRFQFSQPPQPDA